MKPCLDLWDFTSATLGFFVDFGVEVSDRPCRNILCMEGAPGISWDILGYLGILGSVGIESPDIMPLMIRGQATAIGKNSKSVTDFLEKKCLDQQCSWRLVSNDHEGIQYSSIYPLVMTNIAIENGH